VLCTLKNLGNQVPERNHTYWVQHKLDIWFDAKYDQPIVEHVLSDSEAMPNLISQSSNWGRAIEARKLDQPATCISGLLLESPGYPGYHETNAEALRGPTPRIWLVRIASDLGQFWISEPNAANHEDGCNMIAHVHTCFFPLNMYIIYIPYIYIIYTCIHLYACTFVYKVWPKNWMYIQSLGRPLGRLGMPGFQRSNCRRTRLICRGSWFLHGAAMVLEPSWNPWFAWEKDTCNTFKKTRHDIMTTILSTDSVYIHYNSHINV
jgi:hypothetical protein